MFYVGQKVVCVDDAPDASGAPSLVEAGAVYTIRARYEPSILEAAE